MSFFDDIEEDNPQPQKKIIPVITTQPVNNQDDIEDIDDIDNIPVFKPTSSDDAKTKRDRLAGLLEDMEPFDAAQYIADNDDLPAREVRVFDYEGEMNKIRDKCADIIDVICRNYIKSDAVFAHNKVVTIREEQRNKLSDIQYLINSSIEALNSIKEAISSGDLNPENFKIQKMFQEEVRNNHELYTKHRKDVEAYWEKLSEKLGLDETGETEAFEKDKPSETVSAESPAKSSNVVSVRDMNARIEEAMKKINIEKEKKREINI